MDVKIIQGFLDHDDPAARIRSFQYYEQLKESEDGWKLSLELLTSTNDREVKIFCFQVVLHYIKTKYSFADSSQQLIFRKFVSHWIQYQCSSSIPDVHPIQNKAAQMISEVFLCDYPSRWPSFFDDLLDTLNLGTTAIFIYLRILQAINSEIADREISRTQKDLETYTLIKDTMRETCISKLVDTLYHILVTYQNNPELVQLCLEVIGAFIAWINISLIANDRFVQIFMNFLSMPVLREATCDCINQIIKKGMDPVAKVQLVESYVTVLERSGVLNFTGSADDEDFMVSLANLVNGMGIAILNSWSRLQKLENTEGMDMVANAITMKTDLLLKFLGNDDDEVSQAVTEFAREYLQFLKSKANVGAYGVSDSKNVEAILSIVINKYKFDKSMDFTVEGEEASFTEYRKYLKVLFDNLAMLDVNLVFSHTKQMITDTLYRWQSLPYEDVEVAITFLYLLGEAIPKRSDMMESDMREMLQLLVTSGVSRQGHFTITLQFFETVVKFDKFFAQKPQYIPEILRAFLDERGLRNNDPHIKSRACYLFSRFVKSLKSHMSEYSLQLVDQLQDLLVLAPPDNGYTHNMMSPEDQLYLYETAAILIVSGKFEPEEFQRKRDAFERLLSPVAEKFENLLQKLLHITDEDERHIVAKYMSHAIAVTSQTSKAFSNQQTMKSFGCVEVYLQALQVFLRTLDIPYEQVILQSAIRMLLHRMVVCLESEVLPYFPTAANQLLKSYDIRSIQEFIPLLNQVISKFKNDVAGFVQQIFVPFVDAIFIALSVPVDDNDQPAQNERNFLRRSYFYFIAAVLTHNTGVIASQDMQIFERLLLTVIQGAVDFPDPVGQKTCFSILKKMVELWGGPNEMNGFVKFIYSHIVPACFVAPLKDTFDLNDAQTFAALSESASCLKTVLEKRGDEFVTYLKNQYLPTLNVSSERLEEYCQALKSDHKMFRNYLRFFFQNVRT